MFIYNDNKQVKTEYKKVLLDEGISMTDVARKLDMIPQQLNNKFNNTRLAFSDIEKFLDAIGYDLSIDFVKRT